VDKLKERYYYSLLLLSRLIKTDFKLRYRGSVLGYLWSVLKPLAIFVVLYFVFVKFLKIGDGIPHYAIYLLLGIVLWNYFMELTTGAISSIVGKGDLIRKINFPKYVIVFSSSASALINLGINFVIIFIFMLLFGADASWWALIIIPLVIIEITVLGLGIGLLLSALFVKYRDISYIWEVISQAAFYATPILYPLSIVPVVAQKILILNPMAQALQTARYYLVTPKTVTISDIFSSVWIWFIPLLFVMAIFILGAVYFRNNSKFFAEEV
jgi:ABC-2 type transport system permease protein